MQKIGVGSETVFEIDPRLKRPSALDRAANQTDFRQHLKFYFFNNPSGKKKLKYEIDTFRRFFSDSKTVLAYVKFCLVGIACFL